MDPLTNSFLDKFIYFFSYNLNKYLFYRRKKSSEEINKHKLRATKQEEMKSSDGGDGTEEKAENENAIKLNFKLKIKSSDVQ